MTETATAVLPVGERLPAPMVSPIDRFIPRPDVRERHETVVHAPAALVLEVARELDMQSIPLVHAIFWLRAKLMGSKVERSGRRKGFVAETRELGWGLLAEEPGRLFMAGAACQPWHADVVFRPIPPERFAAFAEPDQVKIVWTLEAEPLGPESTRFASETRVVATDERALLKFRRYWRWAGFGILTIRWLLLPAIRREAERQWRETRSL